MAATTEPHAAIDGEPAILFGPFRLVPARRLLLEGDRPVRIGSRAFDILSVLIEHAGRVVSREELIGRAWPQTFVDDSNLKIQVSALRRALGDGQGGYRYVVTVPGRGYNFVAPVSRDRPPQASPTTTIAQAATDVRNHNLPYAMTRMIGRESAAAAIMSRLSRERLVTVVGAGGIGKTTVALAVAEQMIPAYEQGVWLVDLAPLGHPRLVASTVAAVFGLEIHAEDPLPGLVAALRERRILLLLDNCEHVIDTVVNLAAAVLRGAPGVGILATSREPLGVEGEHVHRLRPLSSPQSFARPTAADAAAFPAIQLFVERVTAVVEDFALTDANAPRVAEICRRLDGLPLAIEFAAPRVGVLGVDGLAAHLGGSLPQLTAHRRASSPRHRTMRYVVDWSYSLLTKDEQTLFRSLGIFAGGFTIEAAVAVAMEPVTTPAEAIDRLADLVTKSLIVADVSDAHPRFRLLDTTRAYAIEKLDGSGEREGIARRHAAFYRQLVDRPGGKAARPGAEWLADCALEIDNVRAALDWSLPSSAHATIGIEITAAYVPVWINLSLAAECRQRCERALLQLETHQISDDRLRMLLQIGLGNGLVHTRGPSEQAQTILTEALTVADTLSDADAQLRILLILSTVNVYRGEYARGTAEVERAAEIADRIGDMSGLVVAERRMGTTLLTMGRLSDAQQCLERAIRSSFYLEDERSTVRQRSGDRAMARAMLARALWLRGLPDAARREAQASLDELGGSDLTMCRVIYLGIGRIAPMTGDFDTAENAVSRLIELAQRVNVPFWMTAGQFLRGKLLVERRAFAEGLAVLRDAFEICRQTGWRLAYPEFTGSLALALAGLGRLDEAHDAVAGAIESSGGPGGGQQWYAPELLRIKAQILLQRDSPGVLAAESCLDQAAAMAREQGALFWELRIALSLCRLRLTQGRSDAGRQELGSVYGRFSEGFDTADAIAAKLLLDDLGSGGDK